MRPSNVLSLLTSPWAIMPEKLIEIHAIYSAHLRGEKVDIEALEARLGQPLKKDSQGYENRGGVAIVPIEGPLAKKMNLFTQISGGSSMQLVERDIHMALADSAVKGIILNVDSPGGTVDGVQSLAQVISQARESKPVVSWTGGMMASAAYWAGSAAQSVWISGDTPVIGSIGVVAAHVDVSQYEAKLGIKTTEIYSGKFKRIDSQYSPLTKDGKQYIQDQTDYLYAIFVQNVAAQRGVSESQVLTNMADGRIFMGKQAVSAGLVDGVATLDSLIADLAVGGTKYCRTMNQSTTNAQHKGDTSMNNQAMYETSEQIEQRCREQWGRDAAIRAEFLDLANYTAYERANAEGKVKIYGRNTVQQRAR